MSTVGSVLINFGAGTAGYFAGSKSVKDDAAGLPSFFTGIGGSLTGIFAGIGGALSAGAIVEGLKNAGEAVGGLARESAKLSVGTEELSRLRFAAQESGVDAEALSTAMLKLQVNTGKAAVEGGETAKVINQFGLNVKQLARRRPRPNNFRMSRRRSHPFTIHPNARPLRWRCSGKAVLSLGRCSSRALAASPR